MLAVQARAAATRENIVKSASEVFASTNYHVATMAELARAAGVTQGALYFHFASKRELALEIVRRQHAQSIAAGAMFLRSEVSGIEAMVRLSGLLAAQIQASSVVRAGLRLSTESASALGGDVRAPFADWRAAAEALIARAREAGDVTDGLTDSVAAGFVVGSFTGTQLLSGSRSSWTDLQARLEEMWTVLIPVLVGRDRAPRFAELPALVYRAESDLEQLGSPIATAAH